MVWEAIVEKVCSRRDFRFRRSMMLPLFQFASPGWRKAESVKVYRMCATPPPRQKAELSIQTLRAQRESVPVKSAREDQQKRTLGKRLRTIADSFLCCVFKHRSSELSTVKSKKYSSNDVGNAAEKFEATRDNTWLLSVLILLIFVRSALRRRAQLARLRQLANVPAQAPPANLVAFGEMDALQHECQEVLALRFGTLLASLSSDVPKKLRYVHLHRLDTEYTKRFGLTLDDLARAGKSQGKTHFLRDLGFELSKSKRAVVLRKGFKQMIERKEEALKIKQLTMEGKVSLTSLFGVDKKMIEKLLSRDSCILRRDAFVGDAILRKELSEILDERGRKAKKTWSAGELTQMRNEYECNRNLAEFMRNGTDLCAYGKALATQSDHSVGTVFEALLYNSPQSKCTVVRKYIIWVDRCRAAPQVVNLTISPASALPSA
uniref:Uncharacterized protein n=1 Tax=Erythrolobus australicus TaxID=1077150 RepID=A0A7S1TLI2_9RHOD